MEDNNKIVTHKRNTEEDLSLYDPFSRHFISQNRQNDFLKSLEEGQAELAHSTIQ